MHIHVGSYSGYFVRCVFVVAVLASATGVCAQGNISIQLATGENVGDLVEQWLVGTGVYVSNVEFNGSSGAIGSPQIASFHDGGFVPLQMDSGLVMTTGHASVAVGPNNRDDKSSAVSNYYSDLEMLQLMPTSSTIRACATLDFDFVSLSPFVAVSYCFGSEEYPEYVCSSFNDMFAFLVTGPDPATGETRTWNIASIPHTTSVSYPDGIAVAINSVNDGTIDANPGAGCFNNFSQYYVTNVWSTGIQYDGFTQKLSASATIMPCQQYHMHISVCNVSDNQYDSGVFLEARSFNSPMAQVNISNGRVDTVVHSHPLAVPLSVAGSDYDYGMAHLSFGGSARPGVDYLCLSSDGDTLDPLHNSVDISGEGHTLTVMGMPGIVIEDTLDIEIAVRTSLCQEYPELVSNDTLRFVLVEDDIVALRDTTIHCPDTCRQVGVEVAVARRPLSFRWHPTDGIDHPDQQYSTAAISSSTIYRVSAVDAMGNSDTATVHVVIGDAAIVSPDNAEDSRNRHMRLYPNPASSRLVVEADNMREMHLYNSTGVCVAAQRANGHAASLDIRHLPAGFYVMVVVTDDGTLAHSCVIQ